jgi:hypothetical protein
MHSIITYTNSLTVSDKKRLLLLNPNWLHSKKFILENYSFEKIGLSPLSTLFMANFKKQAIDSVIMSLISFKIEKILITIVIAAIHNDSGTLMLNLSLISHHTLSVEQWKHPYEFFSSMK